MLLNWLLEEIVESKHTHTRTHTHTHTEQLLTLSCASLLASSVSFWTSWVSLSRMSSFSWTTSCSRWASLSMASSGTSDSPGAWPSPTGSWGTSTPYSRTQIKVNFIRHDHSCSACKNSCISGGDWLSMRKFHQGLFSPCPWDFNFYFDRKPALKIGGKENDSWE